MSSTTNNSSPKTALLLVALAGLLGALLTTAAAGCQEAGDWNEPGPRAVFEEFLMHWFKGEREKAFELIAPEDREALTAPLEELDGNVKEKVLPESHEMLVAGRVDNPYDIKRMTVDPPLDAKPAAGKRITLKLYYQDGREGHAQLLWDGEQWFVDLPIDGHGSKDGGASQ